VPANVIPTRDGTIHRRSIGRPLAKTVIGTKTFWTYLWMWDNIQGGKMGVEGIRTALTDGSFIGVIDGSYNRVCAKYRSGLGWVICYTKTRHLLQGLFFETSPKAGSYRGELLSLVALHMMIAAVTQFYKVIMAIEKICCDNISAPGQSSKTQKRVSTGIKHSDLHRAIQTIKCTINICMVYSHVRAHQNRILPWSMMTLEQQLNVICDELANGAVAQFLSDGQRDNHSPPVPLV
jgi:hypothetical protein